MTRELLRLGKDPAKMTRVEVFAATRLVSEGVVGVPRIGVPHSLTPVKTPSVRLAEIARQAMEIRTHIGAPGGSGKHNLTGTRGGVVGGIAAIGEASRHQQLITTTNIQIQAATKAAQRPAAQVSL
jgi:tetrahydromethanopterin S-methyltransferase subunit H